MQKLKNLAVIIAIGATCQIKNSHLTLAVMGGLRQFAFLLAVGCAIVSCNEEFSSAEITPNSAEALLENNIVKEMISEDSTEPQSANSTITDVTGLDNSTLAGNETKKLVSCKYTALTNTSIYERRNITVELINASRLAEILTPDAEVTNRESEAECTIILFYSKLCPFSILAAPHFNALIKQFPYIKMAAVDTVQHSRVNTQYGIVGVPSMILFHNARAVAKYDSPEHSLQAFSKFVKTFTGLDPVDGESLNYFLDDLVGPVPTKIEEEMDYILILAWSFIIMCLLYLFSGTRFWKTLVETVKSSWREAEAQHEHRE